MIRIFLICLLILIPTNLQAYIGLNRVPAIYLVAYPGHVTGNLKPFIRIRSNRQGFFIGCDERRYFSTQLLRYWYRNYKNSGQFIMLGYIMRGRFIAVCRMK